MPQANGHALHLHDVTKTFRPKRKWFRRGDNKDSKPIVALDAVAMHIAPQEVLGVLGPNGSGKSTLIRVISTLMLPDRGEIRVFGRDAIRQPLEVKRLINRVSVEAAFFKQLSPMENLIFSARLHGLSGREGKRRIYEILDRLRLKREAIGRPMQTLSRGMQQKAAVARALLTEPKVLLLDEPTTGLDPRSKLEVQQLVRELRDELGTTVLLTTHDMNEAEKLCDRIAIIDGGRIIAEDTAEGLKAMGRTADQPDPTLEDAFLAITGHGLDDETDDETEPEQPQEDAA